MNTIRMGVLAAGLLSLGVSAQPTQGPELKMDIQLENAWVRAMPPSQSMTAAYLTVVNQGTAAAVISGANTEIAQGVEIHTTRTVDGLMRMQELPGLTVKPGERVELAPGGTHLMLLGVTSMPKPGDMVELCMSLESGDKVCTQAPTSRTAPEFEGH